MLWQPLWSNYTKKHTHAQISSSWIHKCYTVMQSHHRCHLFSLHCSFSFPAYLELWEIYCHSLADRKSSQTSNILISFKLSPRLMVSCHCCGIFLRAHQEVQQSIHSPQIHSKRARNINQLLPCFCFSKDQTLQSCRETRLLSDLWKWTNLPALRWVHWHCCSVREDLVVYSS